MQVTNGNHDQRKKIYDQRKRCTVDTSHRHDGHKDGERRSATSNYNHVTCDQSALCELYIREVLEMSRGWETLEISRLEKCWSLALPCHSVSVVPLMWKRCLQKCGEHSDSQDGFKLYTFKSSEWGSWMQHASQRLVLNLLYQLPVVCLGPSRE